MIYPKEMISFAEKLFDLVELGPAVAANILEDRNTRKHRALVRQCAIAAFTGLLASDAQSPEVHKHRTKTPAVMVEVATTALDYGAALADVLLEYEARANADDDIGQSVVAKVVDLGRAHLKRREATREKEDAAAAKRKPKKKPNARDVSDAARARASKPKAQKRSGGVAPRGAAGMR